MTLVEEHQGKIIVLEEFIRTFTDNVLGINTVRVAQGPQRAIQTALDHIKELHPSRNQYYAGLPPSVQKGIRDEIDKLAP